MKIIEPKVELWQQGGDAKAHVARCARVCPNCIFNNYLCYGLLCNIVVLKIIKDEEK